MVITGGREPEVTTDQQLATGRSLDRKRSTPPLVPHPHRLIAVPQLTMCMCFLRQRQTGAGFILMSALTLLTLNQFTGPNLPLPAQSKHRRVKGPTVALMSLPSPFMHSCSLFRSYWAHRLKICPLRSSTSPSSSLISLRLCSSGLSLH